jgi:hypothetical protein
MASVHKTIRDHFVSQRLIRSVVGDKFYDQAHFAGSALVKAQTPEQPGPVVPMPDTEEIQRQKRRQMTQAALQRTGRASTILSDSDRLGP